jgi:hypothetical protein
MLTLSAAFLSTTLSNSVHFWTGALTLESSTLFRDIKGHVLIQSIACEFLNSQSTARNNQGTYEHKNFEILLVVVHNVRHETEPS